MRQNEFARYPKNIDESQGSQRLLIRQRLTRRIAKAMCQFRKAKNLPSSEICNGLMASALFKTKPREASSNENKILDDMTLGND